MTLKEVDLTYTLTADLSPYKGFEGTSKGLGGNVVLVDTLPSAIEWRSDENEFLVVEGMALTRASTTNTLTKDEFAADEYVGQYYVNGKNLFINIGQDTTTKGTVVLKATESA